MPATRKFYGEVPQLYQGEVAVLFATGPSLTKDVVDAVWPYVLEGKVRAIGVNDAYRMVPYLEVLYACDPGWWEHHIRDHWVLDYLCDTFWTQDRAIAKKLKLSWVAGRGGHGLYDTARDRIHYGATSGFQVLNLALHMGFRRFILCGYNYSSGHFFGKHAGGLQNTDLKSAAQFFAEVQPAYRKMVVNCTPGSNLNSFERRELTDVLRELE